MLGGGVEARSWGPATASRVHGKRSVVQDVRVVCSRRIDVCSTFAIDDALGDVTVIHNCKRAGCAEAVVSGKPSFHISLAIDISPDCDCHGENDMPIVPNIGMFASFDPVAIDVACADAVNAQEPLKNSVLGERCHCCHDHFTAVAPATNWHSCTDHAAKIGLGSCEYELVVMK